MPKKTDGGRKAPIPKGDTTQSRRQAKRISELKYAAELNGFETWSAMITYVKNQALLGVPVVKNCKDAFPTKQAA